MAGELQEVQIGLKVTEAEFRQAALLLAEQFAWTPQFEVGLGDAEAISGFFQHTEAFPGLRISRFSEQDAKSIVRTASDTAAQLVELGNAKLLGVFHKHHGCIWNVHADFD